MIRPNIAASLALLSVAFIPATCTLAQAAPTATRAFELSVFGGVSGVYTGLSAGRNVSITAGGDIGFRRLFTLQLSGELRGTYAIDKGSVDSQENILGGLKAAKGYGRFHPYADILFGRGEINYGAGYVDPTGTVEYLENPTNVLSPGAGVDVDLTPRFAMKADAQYQRYNTPVTTSGTLYSKPITLALIYRFGRGY